MSDVPSTGVRPRAVNGLAIAGFVLSLLWLGGLGSLLAIVFTAVALRQVRDRNESGQGLAIAGLVLGILGLVGSLLIWGTFLLGEHTKSKFDQTCQQISVSGQCQ